MLLSVKQHLLERVKRQTRRKLIFLFARTFNDTRERGNIIIATVSLVILDCSVRLIITA